MTAHKLISRLCPNSTALFLCDMQEKFRPLIYNFPSVLNRCRLLTKTSKILSIPCIITEQYSRVFGKTVEEIPIFTSRVFDKKKFSMLTPEVELEFKSLDKKRVILCGIEAHACIYQTGLDLLEEGYEVHIPCDAVSSQRPHDRTVALHRLQSEGAILTTAEAVVLDLTRTSDHPDFRAISALLKESNSDHISFANSANV